MFLLTRGPFLALSVFFVLVSTLVVLQVKASRETRNLRLVAHLNAVLSDSVGGEVYFVSPDDAKTFTTFTVAEVGSWAAAHAGLLEPTSLGRPHFLKFLTTVRVPMLLLCLVDVCCSWDFSLLLAGRVFPAPPA